MCFHFQPIIPMFTQNVRETFRTLSLGKGRTLGRSNYIPVGSKH